MNSGTSGIKKHLFPLVFLMLFIWACAEDEVTVENDPTIKVQFINADSLSKLSDSLTVLDDSILVVSDSLTTLNDSLTVLSDSLVILNDSIANGRVEYTASRDLLLAVQVSFNTTADSIQNVSTLLTTDATAVSSIINTINSGDLLVTSITNSDNGAAVVYSDSTTSYNLPVAMNADASNFIIEITGATYLVELTYEREETVDEKRRVKILPINVSIVNSEFDSVSCVSLNCENETPIKFYF